MATILRVPTRDALLWVHGLIDFTTLCCRVRDNERSLYILRLTDHGLKPLLRTLAGELAKHDVDAIVWFAHTPLVFKWSALYAQIAGCKDSIDSQRFLCYSLDQRIERITNKLNKQTYDNKRS